MYMCANKEKPSLFIQPHTAALTGHLMLEPDCTGNLKNNSHLFQLIFSNTVYLWDLGTDSSISKKKSQGKKPEQTALNKPPG